MVKDVSVEDKTNLLDLSESRNETSQKKKSADKEDQVVNTGTQKAKDDTDLINNDLNILNKEEEEVSKNVLSNPQEEINFDNNKENNFSEEYLQQNQTETKNTISEVSTIEPSEEIIQSNTGMNESRVSNLNERIIDDEGNKNGAASNEELTLVKSNTASNDDAQKHKTICL